MFSALVIRGEVAVPPEELAKHYEIAADQDNVNAMCADADMLKTGHSVLQNVAKAMIYYGV
jgi:TPR repeat protein